VGNHPDIVFKNEVKEIDKNIVASNLKNFRLDNHLTQNELADAINTSQANIHKYEAGKTLITTTYALEFSKQYNYSLDKLIRKN
jgi:transcriptional regulator with XRE-family HTH domain